MTDSRQNLLNRLWRKDVTLWQGSGATSESLSSRLGWLDAVSWMGNHQLEITNWVETIIHSGKFDHLVLLGMGGSSLAPEVFYSVFGHRPGYLNLILVDTTSPEQIQSIDIDLKRSMVIVASKSGTTVETADLYAYFYQRISQVTDCPGEHMIAITDPHSWLHSQAVEHEFCKVFLNPAEIGGRYSALSYFGLVPAALTGVDLSLLLDRTKLFMSRVFTDDPTNPVLKLAEAMAKKANLGSHIMNLRLSNQISSLAAWIEQLVAESTGKNGTGVIPVFARVEENSECKNGDQFAVEVEFGSEHDNEKSSVLRWKLAESYDLGAEFLRWEMATALAASMMDINPFDQPNVEEAKVITRTFVDSSQSCELNLLFECNEFSMYCRSIQVDPDTSLTINGAFELFDQILENAKYLAVLAYLPRFGQVDIELEKVRILLGQRFSLTTTLGYGPRYLHSTGQLHKGGPTAVGFVQFVERTDIDLSIPGRKYGFFRSAPGPGRWRLHCNRQKTAADNAHCIKRR